MNSIEMSKVSITIITPVLNGESWVQSCVESVAQQGIINLEHLIFDGGSKDKTLEMLKEVSNQHPHVRVFSEPGTNQSQAMNRGIEEARAAIIGILNIDDFYSSGTLKSVLECFELLSEPSFLTGNCKILDEFGSVKFINRPRNLKLIDMLIGSDYAPFPFNSSAYFYHKSIHQIVGMYDEEDNFTMDLDFILRVSAKVRMKYVDRDWGNFRMLPGSKTFDQMELGKSLWNGRRTRLKAVRRLKIGEQALVVARYVAIRFMKFIKKTSRCAE